jgi:hypothetical protein
MVVSLNRWGHWVFFTSRSQSLGVDNNLVGVLSLGPGYQTAQEMERGQGRYSMVVFQDYERSHRLVHS